jgi:hypothetical protein
VKRGFAAVGVAGAVPWGVGGVIVIEPHWFPLPTGVHTVSVGGMMTVVVGKQPAGRVSSGVLWSHGLVVVLVVDGAVVVVVTCCVVVVVGSAVVVVVGACVVDVVVGASVVVVVGAAVVVVVTGTQSTASPHASVS